MRNHTVKQLGLAALILTGLNFTTAGTALGSPQASRFQIQTPKYNPPPIPRQQPALTAPRRQTQYSSEYPTHNVPPENRPYNNSSTESRSNLGVNHPNTTASGPTVITPATRHAMTYNTRSGGIHIDPEYFATHYGYAHGFKFANYAGGPCIGDCGLRVFGGEWYFTWNGGWFGIMGQMPGNWAFQTDYLYIDVGDDGNYYLYDAQFPDMAVQLTFVQNIGDDQAGADEDQGD